MKPLTALLLLSMSQYADFTAAMSESSGTLSLKPSATFIQAGAAEDHTRAYLIGFAWDLPWKQHYDFGWLGAYVETSIGRWSTHRSRGGSAWVTQVGFTPVLRFNFPDEYEPWFIELGVGANFIVPVYRNQHKSFSSKFNFGDHVAFGRRFGQGLNKELALRVEHFSNAGIDEPNPGENFVQLRYSFHFS